ncbi:hypothetical protein GH714_043195 [Hevea brasiliensis]|uniref:Thioesterase domain-containing protein n=1 Tax=Hevea brasiliensis TaxID=3981 RepID=A0A6A6K3C3_HEVBR|nr:hypothetical protein GH714_043195 [Hevea brasiliensis]
MAKIPSSAAGAATVSSLSEETSSVSTETIISNDLPPGSAEEIMELFDHSGNYFKGLHGGAVAAIAERVAIACARTVVAEDKHLFLGELSISYLSAALQNEVLLVDGSIVRSGRNLSVVAMEFKIKKTRKLVYTARATFYHMPVAKL